MPLLPATKDDLERLHRLREVWQDLLELVVTSYSQGRIGEGDEEKYEAFLHDARVLYGRLRPVVGTAGLQRFGRTFDAFQYVLGQPTIYEIIRDQTGAYHWQQLWSAADSVIAQAIGQLEGSLARARLPLDPEAAARWAPLVNLLEKTRRRLTWLVTRPRPLGSLVDRIEGSPFYRVASILTTSGALIALLLIFLAGAGALIKFIG
jgi:hypothetical protein